MTQPCRPLPGRRVTADIYVRVSSTQQLKGTGLDRQEAVCRDWCKANGVKVRKLIKDACSAFHPEHLAAESKSPWKGNLGRALRAWEENPRSRPSFLVCEEWDRLSRMNELENVALLLRFADLGIRLVVVWDPRTDPILMARLERYQAELEGRKIPKQGRALLTGSRSRPRAQTGTAGEPAHEHF